MRLSALALCCGLLPLVVACSTTQQAAPVAPAGFYRVKPGDTLYRIAVNHRQTVANLVRWNGLKDAASINAGQLLRVAAPGGGSANNSVKPPASKPAAKPATKPAPVTRIALAWPTRGPLLAKFNGGSNKGIDIGGEAGSTVLAAAGGKVVYAGKGIRAYGNLLIIKHDDDTLTTYAHNQKLLAQEGQMVKSGDAVATMGSSGTNRVKLHFELRVRGQAVDPLPYLPGG